MEEEVKEEVKEENAEETPELKGLEGTEETPEVKEEVKEEEVKEEEKEVEESEETKKQKPVKPGDIEYTKAVRKRIDELTFAKNEEKRRADALEARIAELETGVVAKERPERPLRKAFLTEYGELDEDKYEAAMAEYEDKLFAWRDRQKEVAEKTKKLQEMKEQVVQTFAEKVRIAQEKHPDFEEVVKHPVFTPALQDAIFSSEQGAEIAYYLGKNESEAKNLAKLPLAQMLKEFGKLELRFSLEPFSKKVSDAPNPIHPVKGGASVIQKDPSKMTDAEWFEWNKQQKLNKLKERVGG